MASHERDPSVAGKTVGAYSVLSEIGRGGMGVVLLAHDSRLERRVALKALAPEFASDPERLARFAREARTLASLNHPNVAQVYGLEEQDGSRYLVMEFVEGKTLGQILDAGPLAVDEALRLASQIASGVEAAHEQGVIHRDLKPGNIVVTPEGKAKVLDFGLAREVESRGSTMNLSMSPTATLPHAAPTVEGQILGTVAYMSPEQARGKLLSKRTDVWSFGCVLYEMLAGVGPFAGETASDMIAAILEREPDWSKLPVRTPRRVVELLHRCLEKDESQRLRDIGDARLELEKASADREWSTQSMAAFEGAIQFPARSRRWLYASVLLLGASALAAWGGWALRGANAPAPPAPLLQPKFMQATDGAGPELFPSLSPDGKTLVYCSAESGNWDIYRLRVGGSNPTNLTPNCEAEDHSPALSPDGERIVFRSEREPPGIYIMGATGESPRRLTDFGFNPSWSPDGKYIVCAEEGLGTFESRTMVTSSVWVVDALSGEHRELPLKDGVQPTWSPSGARIAFWSIVGGGQRDLFTIPADGSGPATALTNDVPTDWNPVWSRDGKHIYFSSDRTGVMGIWRIAVDETSGKALGAPEPITAGGDGVSGQLTIARSADRIGYALVTGKWQVWRIAFDASTGATSGEPEQVTKGSFGAAYPAVSPDGSLVAYTLDGAPAEDIFVARIDGSGRRRLTDDIAKDRGPRWSPDGKRIAFYSDRGGAGYGIWIMNTDGGGLRRLTRPNERAMDGVWTADGKALIAYGDAGFLRIDPSPSTEFTEPEPIVDDGVDTSTCWPLECSQDGKWMVFIRTNDNRLGFYSFETRTIRLLEAKARDARFIGDTNRALVFSSEGLSVVDADKGEPVLTQSFEEAAHDGAVLLSPDTKWLYYNRKPKEADIWIADLK